MFLVVEVSCYKNGGSLMQREVIEEAMTSQMMGTVDECVEVFYLFISLVNTHSPVSYEMEIPIQPKNKHKH